MKICKLKKFGDNFDQKSVSATLAESIREIVGYRFSSSSSRSGGHFAQPCRNN